jgi:hypothetical protein
MTSDQKTAPSLGSSSHTRGPWEVSDVHRWRVQCSARGELICATDIATEKLPLESIANARLISSAPDMYEAGLQALAALDHIQRRATETGMRGSLAWDELVGGADLYGAAEHLRLSLAKATGGQK